MDSRLLRGIIPGSIGFLAVLAAGLWAPQNAQAYPQFAIEYNVRCTTCHSLAFPKLNATGYEFRRLGFRLPANVANGTPGPVAPGTPGTPGTKYDFSNYFSIASTMGYIAQNPNFKSAAVDSSGGFHYNGASLYAAGPIPGDFAFQLEESLGGNGTTSLANAYMQYDRGNLDNLITVKFGQFSKMEAIGPFDRSILSGGIATSQSINGFSPGGGERGIQLGYTYKQDTSAMVSLFNGIAAPGGGTPADLAGSTQDSNTPKDFMVQAYHTFDKSGTSVSAFYYHGDTMVTSSTPSFDDIFYAAGIGGSYFVTPKLNVMAAYVRGNHDVPSSGEGVASTSLDNEGYLGEVDYGLTPMTVLVAKYEGRDQQTMGVLQQVTAGVAHSFTPFTKLTVQYQNRFGMTGSAAQIGTAAFEVAF